LKPLRISDTVTLPAADLRARAVRSSGPGGQNVNKVASKVELRFDLAGTRVLADDVKARLALLARGRLDAAGHILLTSEAARDQPRNLEDARDKLAALVARALVPPRPRRKTRPTAGSRERRLDAKKRRGVVKRVRRQADE
jgi:ribosome-associated protein